jgi:hypothetical protein
LLQQLHCLVRVSEGSGPLLRRWRCCHKQTGVTDIAAARTAPLLPPLLLPLPLHL